jgi:hypothetical protein
MKKTVEVTQTIEVEVPESLLTEKFMEEFRKDFYDFFTPEDHFCHLAQLRARGLYGNESFIEGYGHADELGIKFKVGTTTTEIVDE